MDYGKVEICIKIVVTAIWIINDEWQQVPHSTRHVYLYMWRAARLKLVLICSKQSYVATQNMQQQQFEERPYLWQQPSSANLTSFKTRFAWCNNAACAFQNEVVQETMVRAVKVEKEMNLEYAIVSYDLAVALKAYSIQSLQSPSFDKLSFRYIHRRIWDRIPIDWVGHIGLWICSRFPQRKVL